MTLPIEPEHAANHLVDWILREPEHPELRKRVAHALKERDVNLRIAICDMTRKLETLLQRRQP